MYNIHLQLRHPHACLSIGSASDIPAFPVSNSDNEEKFRVRPDVPFPVPPHGFHGFSDSLGAPGATGCSGSKELDCSADIAIHGEKFKDSSNVPFPSSPHGPQGGSDPSGAPGIKGGSGSKELSKWPKDRWKLEQGCWIREHNRPRTCMFTPVGTIDGPSMADIALERVTFVEYFQVCERKSQVITDTWLGRDSHRPLAGRWIVSA